MKFWNRKATDASMEEKPQSPALIFVVALSLFVMVAPPVAAQQEEDTALFNTTAQQEEQGGLAAAAEGEVSEGYDRRRDGLDASTNYSVQQTLVRKTKLDKPDLVPGQNMSLFFTKWQHALLKEAKIGFMSRPPTAGEVSQGKDGGPKDPGIREVSLGGIVYNDPQAWTVWLNGQRITPEAIPDEIIDIKVRKNYIDLKWFDSYTSLIYPIRLRQHERFNLDTRIFLPGTL